jgi:hypothetical protein
VRASKNESHEIIRRAEDIEKNTDLHAPGGLQFVHPLLDAAVVPALLSTLSPGTVPPRLIVETLRAINAIAEALATDILSPADTSPMAVLAAQLFTRPTIDCLAEILAQRSKSPAIDEQLTLTMKIISHTLRPAASNQHQTALVKAGVLDFLASRLASLVVKMGHALHPIEPSFVSSLPPSPPRTSLVHLLEALAAIIQHSAYRSMRLLYSPTLLTVFPIASTAPQPQSASEYLHFDQPSPSISPSNPLDYLLPKLQAVQSKNEHSFSKAFPALGSLIPGDSRMPYFNESQTMISSRTISADEFGSPLIAWLMHMARNTTNLERLATLELLTHLISALDQKVMDSWAESSRNRDRTLAFLVVPLLVRIVDEVFSKKLQSSRQDRLSEFSWVAQVKERAPVALAVLVEDCPALQRAAVDANAIKLLCQMLKKSFDPVSTSKKPMWSPVPLETAMDLEDDRTCSLGSAALAPEAVHMLRCRAAALKGLAAIAQKEDAHRKSVIDNGIVSCVVDSLAPYPDGPIEMLHSNASVESRMPETKEGNPNFVIVEACRLATALSRSVSILRTSLIDGGVAKPVFGLLRARDRRVREAATDAVTNLVLQFSPMREVSHVLWKKVLFHVAYYTSLGTHERRHSQNSLRSCTHCRPENARKCALGSQTFGQCRS